MISGLFYINFALAEAAFIVACLAKESAIAWISLFNAIFSLQLANVISKAERNIE